MVNKVLKKVFKKSKDACFFLSDPHIVFMWGSIDGVPNDKIIIGRRGAPRPDHILNPYDIGKIECTKPERAKPGMLTVFGVDGTEMISYPFKDKHNLKQANKFNECLVLYKQYHLGKR